MTSTRGDVGATVALKADSGEVARRYEKSGGRMEPKVAKVQGHNLRERLFRCQEFVLFRSCPLRAGHGAAGKPWSYRT
jgi:hypothetical protein